MFPSSNADTSNATSRRASIGPVEVQNERGGYIAHVQELTAEDQALLVKFGYNPVFKRKFGYLSTFSFAVSISGLFATVATTFYYPLIAGGASSIVWSWFISGSGCMCIALSVSELVSAYPTSGGLYYTISKMTPSEWVPSLSRITGWLNLLGQVAGVASSEYGSAQLILAAASINRGYDPVAQSFRYIPTYGQTVGVMAALTMACGLVNSLSTYWMEKMTKSYVIFHVMILIAGAIALLAATPKEHQHDTEYVFTHVEAEPASGWSPLGWSWLFAFLSVSWTMTDYDATAHIAEETNEPEKKAPWAISMAMLFTWMAGFLYNIVLVFRMGDPAELLTSTLYQPVVQLYYSALGSAGAIFFTVCAVLILQFVCFTAMQALARTIFAFSRDGLVPLSRVWTKINSRTKTPLFAVWLAVFFCTSINLVALGSYVAISGVFSVTAIALDWSYCLPILCKLLFARFEPGPWHLGKFSTIVNVWALVWTSFVSVIFILPTLRPVQADNMNYAVVFLTAILFFAGLAWVVGGKKSYTGPVAETHVRGTVTDSDRSSEVKE